LAGDLIEKIGESLDQRRPFVSMARVVGDEKLSREILKSAADQLEARLA